MDRIRIATTIVGYLVDECGIDEDKVAPDSPLFSSKVLNSLDILNLVTFLEGAFAIRIGTWEVSLEGLDTVGLITEFVERKLG